MRRTLIALFAILITLGSPVWAGPKAVVFVVSSTSLGDLASPGLPHFHQIFTKGSAGLMNARTAGTPSGQPSSTGLEAACLTIGAGTRAVGGYAARKAYQSGDRILYMTAAQTWSARTLLPKPDAEVVQPSVAGLTDDNSRRKHKIAVGELARVMHAAGLKTAVIGNSDTRRELHREVVGIAMDENGLVDYGNVGQALNMKDPSSPFGLSADHKAYLHTIDRVWGDADLIVVDAGDTLRAAMYGVNCVPKQSEKLQKQAMERADKLLGKLMRRMDPAKDLLVVLSPNFSYEAKEDRELLTPILVYGPDYRSGLLTSASTRREGVITNADIAPSVLAFFGLETPSPMVGRPVSTLTTPDAKERLTAIEHRLALRSRQQPLSRWIATAVVIVVILSTLGLVLVRDRVIVPTWLVLLPSSAVFSALYMPSLGLWDLGSSAVVLALLSVSLVLLLLILCRNALSAFTFFCLALCGGLILDVFSGTGMLKESVLSYSASEGARYYGLGNEYMGAFIGAAILGSALLLRRMKLSVGVRQLIAALFLGLVAVTIGAPFLGANTGGTMSIVPAVLVALRLRTGRALRVQYVAGIAGAIVLSVGALILVDSLLGNGQSHIGRFGDSLSSGGFSEFLLVIQRKLAMNYTLFMSSLWSRLMLISAAAVALLWFSPRTGVAGAIRKCPELSAGIAASIVGAASAFVFNDSGVVAAATCLIYPWSALMILSLNKQPDRC